MYPKATLLAGLVLTATLPLAFAGGTAETADAQGCFSFSKVDWLFLSHEGTDEITATELLYLVVMSSGALASQRNLINGLDGFVINLNCKVGAATFCATRQDAATNDYDLGVRFYSESLAETGDLTDPASDDVCGNVPVNSAWAVVYALEGIPLGGLASKIPPYPFILKFKFEMLI